MSKKYTTVALVAGLLFVASVHAGHSDTDEIPDAIEHAACGTPATTEAINEVAVLGSCDQGTGDYVLAVGNAPPACADCNAQVVFDRQDLLLSPAQDVGPLSTPPEVNVSTIHAYFDALQGRYCIDILPSLPEAACVFGPFGDVPELGPFHLLNATVPQQHAQATSVDLHFEYRFIEDHITPAVSLLSGEVVGYYPVDPFDSDEVAWWAMDGNQTSLDFELQFRLDGQPVGEPMQFSLPYVGQQVAAMLKSSPENPFPL